MTNKEACASCMQIRRIIGGQPYPRYSRKVMRYDVPFQLCFTCDAQHRSRKEADKLVILKQVERNLMKVMLRNMIQRQIQTGQVFFCWNDVLEVSEVSSEELAEAKEALEQIQTSARRVETRRMPSQAETKKFLFDLAVEQRHFLRAK